LVTLVTLVTLALSQNFSFLRVFRIVRLVRAFEFLDQKTMVGRWFNINSCVVAKVVNLVVFVFLVTALVYVSQVRHNPHITSYLDALYFTIGTLTPVGLGDVTLPDTLRRWITLSVMVLGVTLFLQLIRAIAVGDKVHHHCPACQLPLHDRDAAPASAAARAFFPKAG
jgi:voltage-gated potassium channel